MNEEEKDSKYYEYINSYRDYLIEKVNLKFSELKESIKEDLIEYINGYLNPIPKHYDIVSNEFEPWDYSGELKENGLISLDLTISEFLENEYTGQYEATYMSGCGWRYFTYGDDLSNYTLEMASDIMYDVIKEEIEKHFSVDLDKEEIDLNEIIYNNDEIYENTKTYEFFSSEEIVNEYLKIGEMKLSEIYKEK